MPQAGFEPTIPAFKRAKPVHALDGTATVIGTAACTWMIWQADIYINKVPLKSLYSEFISKYSDYIETKVGEFTFHLTWSAVLL
jgi:hypothetical protein